MANGHGERLAFTLYKRYMIEAEIYLNEFQCRTFFCDYNGPKKLIAAADSILASRPAGYDAKHVEILEPIGSKLIVAEPLGKGWFKITRIAD